MTGHRLLPSVTLIALAVAIPAAVAADSPDYLRDVRPILAENCFACHGPDDTQRQAGLRLDQRSAATSPLESGAVAIIAGRADASELVRRIESRDDSQVMPPPESNHHLDDSQKQLLRDWIEGGAEYREHWAYLRPDRPVPPVTLDKTWCRNEIDHFVLAKLESLGLQPAPEADRITLIRRLSLDLTGLPPTIAEVDQFLKDDRADAYERLVDRLLASPHFGEKLAQDWLDLARFGDSSGYQDDGDRPNSPYRDYVIGAFNANMPFDQFTLENLAGDLLPNASRGQMIASGFNRLHRHNEEGGSDPDEFQVVYAVDRTNTMATTWMGLTLGCAQCHNHKYDPFSQREYYQLYAFFNSLEGEVPVSKSASPPQIRVPSERDRQRLEQLNSDIAQTDEQQHQLEPEMLAAFEQWFQQQPEPTFTPDTPAATAEQNVAELSLDRILSIPREKMTAEHLLRLRALYTADHFPQLAETQARLAALTNERTALENTFPQALIWQEMAVPRAAHILLRGDWQRPGDLVERNVPAVLPPLASDLPRNRLALAQWLISDDHPLTSRVAMNRLWKQCFGAGLVRTPEDFGVRGEPPTHPELLDWLATKFRCGTPRWDTKRMLRLLVTSATYRQSSAARTDLRDLDADNRLLARGARFRISAEEIRDMALNTSGLLTHDIGGRSIYPYQPDHFYRDKEDDPGEWKWPLESGAQLYRRGLYTFMRRTTPYPSYQTFDSPNRGECTVSRSRTNTPLQALVTLNDPVFVEAARVLAERTSLLAGDDDARIVFAFRSVLSRPPSPREQLILQQLLHTSRARYAADIQAAQAVAVLGSAPPAAATNVIDVAAWAAVASALLNLDESITRE